jgi:heat shock protein HslJ
VQDCPEPDGNLAQEAAYMSALVAVTRYPLTGDTLTLLDAGGAERLVFVQE